VKSSGLCKDVDGVSDVERDTSKKAQPDFMILVDSIGFNSIGVCVEQRREIDLTSWFLIPVGKKVKENKVIKYPAFPNHSAFFSSDGPIHNLKLHSGLRNVGH